jgi:N-acetylglucosamine-6-phosphate deacetylase
VVVAAGHSEASYEQVRAALDEGLTGFTHLFNAMSQLGSRAPGVVGAALDDRTSWCGLIADGIHVHPASMRIALAARGAEALALVTDAMPNVGGEERDFVLGGRRIVNQGRPPDRTGRRPGRLQPRHGECGPQRAAIPPGRPRHRRPHGQRVPARAMRMQDRGEIRPGFRADLILMNGRGEVTESWIGGRSEAR